MKCLTPACLLLLGALALTGCKATVQQAPSPVIDALSARELGYGVGWESTLNVGEDNKMQRAILVGDAIIFTETPSNIVTAVAIDDGSIRWRRRMAERTDRLFEPALWDGKLLINTENDLFIISINDGSVLETHKLEAVVNHGPAVVDDLAIYGGLNGRIFGHNLIAGYPRWAYQMGGGIVAPPAAHDGLVLLGDTLGGYVMLQADNGNLMWRGRTFAQITAQPALSRLGAFVASNDQNLYSLDRNSGRDRVGNWPYRTTQPLTQAPQVIDNTVYLRAARQGLLAIDAVSGNLMWELPYLAKPIYHDQQRLLLMLDTRLQFVEANTGRVLVHADTQPLHTVVPLEDNSLILITPRGRMVRLIPGA